MAKKIILIVLGLCVVVFAGLTVYVSTMDWNAHKNEIAEKFMEITGKKIEFGGPISVSLLPHPSMSAQNISVLTPQTSERLATASMMQTEVSLTSLLEGTPIINSLSFIDAEIWFNVDEKGSFNWKNDSSSTTSLAEKNARLQSFNLQNALFHYTNEKYGITLDLSQLNADVQAESLVGPYRLDGNFVKDDDHFGIAISLGDISQEEFALNFAVTHPRSESYLRYDGTYNMANSAVNGDFSGSSAKTADFVNILTGKKLLEEDFNSPLSFSVNITTDTQDMKLSGFVIKYGDFIEGSGNLIIPLNEPAEGRKTVELKYQLLNLDVRPLLAALKSEYAEFLQNGGVYKPDTDFDVLVDISADRIIFNDTANGFFENMTIKGDWLDNTLNLEEFFAACPGNIGLTMSGSLIEKASKPQYYLKVDLNGQDLSSFLKALQIDVKPQVQATYRNADISFNITGNTDALTVGDVKFAMDKMNIFATLKVLFKGQNNRYKVILRGDSLNLDNYFAKPEAATLTDNITYYFKQFAFLQNLDIAGKFNFDNVILRGISIENLNLKINNKSGVLTIEDADTSNVLNSSLRFNGKISGFGKDTLQIEDLGYEISSPDTADILENIKLPLPKWKVFTLKKFKANGSVRGNLQAADVTLKSSSEDLHLDYDGKIGEKDNAFTFDGNIDLRSTNAGEFINNIKPNTTDGNLLRGALNCKGQISGNTHDWSFNDAECILGSAKYSGSFSVNKNKKNYDIKANIQTDEFNLEHLVVANNTKIGGGADKVFDDAFISRPNITTDTLNFKLFNNVIFDINLLTNRSVYKNSVFDNLHIHLLNADEILKVENISFVYNGADFSGEAEIAYTETPNIKGSMTANNISIDKIGGKIYMLNSGTMKISGDFSGPADTLKSLFENISGNLKFEISDLSVTGIGLGKIAEDLEKREYSKGVFQVVRDNLQSGASEFAPISADLKMKNGVIDFQNIVFDNPSAEMVMNGKVSLGEWKINEEFSVTMQTIEDKPQFSFSLSGMLNKPILDVNVENLAKKYDAHWERIAEAEEAKKIEEQKLLNEKMATAQTKVKDVSDKLNNFTPTLEKYKSKSEDKAISLWFKDKTERADTINKDLDSMKALAYVDGFSEDDIAKIETKCAEYQNEIEQLQTEAEKQYGQEVKLRLMTAISDFKSINNNSQNLYKDYQKLIQDNFDLLMKINATVVMINNSELKQQQTDIRVSNDELIEFYARLEDKYKDIENISDRDEMENQIADMRQNTERMRDIYSKMEKIRNASADMLLKMYNEQQKIYEEEQAKKAAAKAKEEKENQGNLLANSDNTNDFTVQTSDLPENENVAPKQNGQAAKLRAISDDTEQKISGYGKINSENAAVKQQKTNTQKNDKPLLLPISNDISDTVSGSIKTSYDEQTQTGKNTSSGVLKAIGNKEVKTGGTITVK